MEIKIFSFEVREPANRLDFNFKISENLKKMERGGLGLNPVFSVNFK